MARRGPDRAVLSDSAVAEVVVEKIRAKYKEIRTAFLAYDSQRTGTISCQDFQRMFQDFQMPREQAVQLFPRVDTKGEGFIDFAQFSRMFGPALQPSYPAPRVPVSPTKPMRRPRTSADPVIRSLG